MPAGTKIRFELIPDGNRNFRLDDDERPMATQTKTIEVPLASFAKTEIRFDWSWVDKPTWICVTADPDNAVAEFYAVNNRLYTETELLPKCEILGPAACGPYYSSLMNYCHPWLHPANAGKIQSVAVLDASGSKQTLVLDASRSYDAEGLPIEYYAWQYPKGV